MDTPVRNVEARPSLKWVCVSCAAEYQQEQSKCSVDGAELKSVVIDAIVGTTFAQKYEIITRLGRGGMSTVYKAHHTLMDKMLALKLMHVYLLTDSAHVKRFQVEAKAASSLSHPNLIKVNDFGITDDGIPFLVMEYIEGQSLNDVLKKQNFISVEQCLEILTQVLDGLAHVHSHGIIHRDLKPGNVMISVQEDGKQRAMIVDFGIAKMLETGDEQASAPLTVTGDVCGSPAYMSPEQCLGKTLDSRSDLYAIGCMLYQCLTGRFPFVGSSALETCTMQVSQLPEPLHRVCPEANIPPLVEDVVLKALEKDPEKRFASAEEFSKTLTSAYEKSKEQEALQFLAARVQGKFKQIMKRVNQNLLAFSAGFLIVVASVSALIYFNPDCRRIAHTFVNPSVYAVCLLCGRLSENANFQLSKWFLNRAVREADFGKVTDNQINSRDELQKLYSAYAYRADAKLVDSEIKAIKSEWLIRRLSIKMNDEDNVFIALLSEMQVPTDQSAARKMAAELSDLSDKSLKRGAYKLAAQQAQKAFNIFDETLHDRSESTLRCLETLALAYEQSGELNKSMEESKKLLDMCKSTPSYCKYSIGAQLSLARVALMQGRSAEAEDWFKKTIDAASKEGSLAAPQLKDALFDYAAFLRRFNRASESAAIEQRLNDIEKLPAAAPTSDRTAR